ncbi:hypothetical protein [Mucilaginibacter sp.]
MVELPGVITDLLFGKVQIPAFDIFLGWSAVMHRIFKVGEHLLQESGFVDARSGLASVCQGFGLF